MTHLLPPGTGTATTELLGLHPPGVGDKESSVVGNKSLLQLDSRGSILVLGVEAVPKVSLSDMRSPDCITYATTPLAIACRRA